MICWVIRKKSLVIKSLELLSWRKLEFINYYLLFGNYLLFGIWNLEFGIWNLEFCCCAYPDIAALIGINSTYSFQFTSFLKTESHGK